jgi:hypothetical protein
MYLDLARPLPSREGASCLFFHVFALPTRNPSQKVDKKPFTVENEKLLMLGF